MASLEVRGSKWYIRFRCDGKNVGLTQKDWTTDKMTKRYMNSIKEQTEREYIENYYTQKKEKEEHENDLTIDEIRQNYFIQLEKTCKLSTAYGIEHILDTMIFDLIANDDKSKYCKDILTKNFFIKVQQNLTMQNICTATKNGYRSKLFCFYDFMVINDQIDATTTMKLKALLPIFKDNEVPEVDDNFYNKDELKQFFDSIDDKSPYKLLCKLLYAGALRRGELMGLKFSDFDFDKDTLTISRQLNMLNKITSPKTKSSYSTIFMPHELMQEVKRFQEEYNASDKSYIAFPDCRLSYVALGTWWNRHFEAHPELKKISLHGLRHTCASIMIANGVPILAVSKHLRHDSPNMTLKEYSHLLKDQDINYIDKLY